MVTLTSVWIFWKTYNQALLRPIPQFYECMELLLNLAWLLLALPAYWLWRDSRTAVRRFRPFYNLLALGCVLVVLFPVVSATDDLRAMRTEMEESCNSKRSIGESHGDRTATGKCQTQPALPSTVNLFIATEWGWYHPQASLVSTPAATTSPSLGRAPPGSSLI